MVWTEGWVCPVSLDRALRGACTGSVYVRGHYSTKQEQMFLFCCVTIELSPLCRGLLTRLSRPLDDIGRHRETHAKRGAPAQTCSTMQIQASYASSTENDLASLGIHGLHDCERLQVIAALTQIVATLLESLLNSDADAFNRGTCALADLNKAIERAAVC